MKLVYLAACLFSLLVSAPLWATSFYVDANPHHASARTPNPELHVNIFFRTQLFRVSTPPMTNNQWLRSKGLEVQQGCRNPL